MSDVPTGVESSLVRDLRAKRAEVERLRISFEQARREEQAIELNLSGVRRELLDDFLETHLYGRGLRFTIETSSSGETKLTIVADAGREAERDALEDFYGGPLTDVPLSVVVNYLGEGLPYASE